MFDSMGNYLYCCQCICTALSVSKQRMANQRKIKRNESLNPLVELTKDDVEQQRLGKYVVMPDSTDVAFNVWWRNLSSSVFVSVRYPHARHWNSGKTSNSAKSTVREDFVVYLCSHYVMLHNVMSLVTRVLFISCDVIVLCA